MKFDLKSVVTVLLSTLLLMFFALLDNFPILTGDSGTYISSGFSLVPPADRPVFYGWFIRLTSLGVSIWLSMFFQCLILVYVLIQFLKKVIPGIPYPHLIAFSAFVSFFTIGGWFASQLMPDIFVAVMILGITNYLLFAHSRGEKALLILLIFIAVLTHNSNYVILTLFCVTVLFAAIFQKKTRQYLKKTGILCCVAVASWVSLCASNLLGGNGFTTSASTPVFIMGKLVESGVLKIYLEKACPVRDYKICAHKDALPAAAWTFLWDSSSPLQKEGGWEANTTEYTAIIHDILSRPKYYPLLAYKSIEATARQLTHYEIDGSYILPWFLFDAESGPFKAVEEHFPHELNQLKSSKLNNKTFNIPFLDSLFLMVIVTSSIIMLFLYPCLKDSKRIVCSILITVSLLLLLNAFTTATLANVLPRLNARVIWLLPFINAVFIYKALQQKVMKRSDAQ